MALAMTLTSVAGFAQNAKSVNLTFGVMYPQTVDATLSYEVGTAHHNAWEFFANAASKWKDCASCGHICAESFWKDNRTWGLGAAYKPCVSRTRNSFVSLCCHYLAAGFYNLMENSWFYNIGFYSGSLRLGGSIGSDTHNVLGGVHAGYEHNYSLKGGWRLFWQVKCDCMIKGDDLFRTGVTIGVKIPTSSTR